MTLLVLRVRLRVQKSPGFVRGEQQQRQRNEGCIDDQREPSPALPAGLPSGKCGHIPADCLKLPAVARPCLTPPTLDQFIPVHGAPRCGPPRILVSYASKPSRVAVQIARSSPFP